MDSLDITLAKLRHRQNLDNSLFLKLYEKLVLGYTDLSEEEKFYLLKMAILFLNSEDANVQILGYRIILRYSNQFGDYEPLYDIALNRSYIPITKYIERKYFKIDGEEKTFASLYVAAYQENFKIEGDDERIYRSLGQLALNKLSTAEENIAVVAPTSYGKSEMIIRKVRKNLGKKICIIVPSKALLAQTKKALVRDEVIMNNFKKIVTYPDMYREEDKNFLAVLTQERLLILLQKNKKLALDIALVDEAHNILEGDERAQLLAQVLLILQKRNSGFLVNFFTPFLVDVKSLNIRNYQIDIKGRPINEHMKVERFYLYDLKLKDYSIYDQFLNKRFTINNESFVNDITFIFAHKASKNIVYLNRPIKVEGFALEAIKTRERIILTPEIQKVIDSISEFLHPNYNLIECIKSGVLYHHGGIPDVVRLYVEEIFNKYKEFEFIITTSTLLEGVNIPAEKIFILTPKKGRGYLSPSQFKNLIGRVCRFREVFNQESGNLKMLEPEIYLINGNYAPKNFAPLAFYEKRVNSSILIKDDIENPMLDQSTDYEKTYDVMQYLERMEPGCSGLSDIKLPSSEIGRLCFVNNIHDFDIIENEPVLLANLRRVKYNKINNADSLINAISSIFFDGVKINEEKDDIIRLKEKDEARNFYAMFISWRSEGLPYPLMIKHFLGYWKEKEKSGHPIVYVGSKWGEQDYGESHGNNFVNISEMNEIQRINLAIAKIKEEQEFIDFNILKYLEVLYELELVDVEYYDRVKYGTSNKDVICMLKNGFSMELSKLLVDKYRKYINIDLNKNLVRVNKQLIDLMRENVENAILIFEAESNF